MKVRIRKVSTNELVEGQIKGGKGSKLPTIHEGWRFNFPTHAKTKGAQAYILVTEENPEEIEGCLIYTMKDNQEPYMAYVEIAPHNRGKKRRYDLVAACLIAFACRLSFILGKEHYKGWLAFDVREESPADSKRLMTWYSENYNAMRFENTTTMLIQPKDGEKLIEKYLKY